MCVKSRTAQANDPKKEGKAHLRIGPPGVVVKLPLRLPEASDEEALEVHDGARGDDEAAVGALGDAAALVTDQDGRGAVGRVAVHLRTGKG